MYLLITEIYKLNLKFQWIFSRVAKIESLEKPRLGEGLEQVDSSKLDKSELTIVLQNQHSKTCVIGTLHLYT